MIEQIFIVTAWIWGVKAVFTDPFIFFKLGEKVEGLIGRWVSKPLFRCPVCMSSAHGTYFFLYFDRSGIMDWALFVMCLAGISFLIKEYLYPEE